MEFQVRHPKLVRFWPENKDNKHFCEFLITVIGLNFMSFYVPSLNHKVDKTEGALDQFPIWIFMFWPYGQLRAVRGKNPIMNYEQVLSSVFRVVMGIFLKVP